MHRIAVIIVMWVFSPVVVSLCGAVAPKPEPSQLLAGVERLGGKATFDENAPGRPIIAVSFVASPHVTDAALEQLEGLSQLQTLELNLTQVTDAGLAHLEGSTNLRWLTLAATKVTDAGLIHLTRLSNLQTLDLFDTTVTKAGVAELKMALPNCTVHHRSVMRPTAKQRGRPANRRAP